MTDFDPCRDIPDDALRATGVDPSTEAKDITGVAFEGWKVCSWAGSWYFLNFYVSQFGMERTVNQNSQFKEFSPTIVAGRDAIRFHTKYDDPGDSCYVAYETQLGTVILAASAMYLVEKLDDTCSVVDSAAEALDRSVPR